jgi:hypothetical protein
MTGKTRKIRKTRKNYKINNTNAKKGTQLKCLMKTCKAKKYSSVYGSTGGSIRSTIGAYF